MALPTLAFAASIRLICASSREASTRPAASSAGVTILEAELRRASDLPRFAWLSNRLEAAVCAGILLLITIAMVAGVYLSGMDLGGRSAALLFLGRSSLGTAVGIRGTGCRPLVAAC